MTLALPLDNPVHPEWVRIPFPLPALLTLVAAGDMRRESTSRQRFFSGVGIDPSDVVVVDQVHSRNVVVIAADGRVSAEPENGPAFSVELRRTRLGEVIAPDADGLLAENPATILGVTVADCMPIFLYDSVTGVSGLLHSGWRGTGILAHALAVLTRRYGTRPEDVVVTMGPCISGESYEVSEERARIFEAAWGTEAVVRRDGTVRLDLRAANQEICRRSGVTLVTVADHCTVLDNRFASFRRDGPDRYCLMLALLGGALKLGDH